MLMLVLLLILLVFDDGVDLLAVLRDVLALHVHPVQHLLLRQHFPLLLHLLLRQLGAAVAATQARLAPPASVSSPCPPPAAPGYPPPAGYGYSYGTAPGQYNAYGGGYAHAPYPPATYPPYGGAYPPYGGGGGGYAGGYYG